MELIPSHIRQKLATGGYDSIIALPNDKDENRWNRVQTCCGLEDAELDTVINIMFPVQQGGVFYFMLWSLISLYYSMISCFEFIFILFVLI